MLQKFVLVLIFSSAMIQSQDYYQPYLLLGESGKSVSATVKELSKSLFMVDFQVLGQYTPEGDTEDVVLIVTHQLMDAALKLGQPESIFFAGLRIAITAKGKMTYISCQNPLYWGRAFFQSDYAKVTFLLEKLVKEVKLAMPALRMNSGAGYGSETGLTSTQLDHYSFSSKNAPGLQNRIVISSHTSHDAAIEQLENMIRSATELELVFSYHSVGSKRALLGFSWSGEKGEKSFMEKLDVYQRRRPAFLPLEIAVIGNEIQMLDSQFRFPLGFPDMNGRAYKKLADIQKTLVKEIGSEN